MIDQSRIPAKRGTLPVFTPVPRGRIRHDGWTPDRQRNFIEALADLGSVRAAAHAVNMTPEGAYHLRRHNEAGEFRKAWEAALSLGVQRLEDVAMERALHGVEVPVYHFGAVVGTRRVYNDRLLMFILRNRAPKRFAADGRPMDAATRGSLARMKKQWRKDWEREAAILDTQQQDDSYTALDEKLGLMRSRWLQNLSPRTRLLYDAYLAAEEEDRASGYWPGDDGEDEDECEEEAGSAANDPPLLGDNRGDAP